MNRENQETPSNAPFPSSIPEAQAYQPPRLTLLGPWQKIILAQSFPAGPGGYLYPRDHDELA